MTSDQDIYLYTLSDLGMKASNVTDLPTALGSILFPPQPYPWWYGVVDAQPVPVPAPQGGGDVVVF
jgi:hypothetical protein